MIAALHIGPGYGAHAVPVIAAQPDNSILIDRLGEPKLGNPVEYRDLLALRRYDYVTMIPSGLGHFSGTRRSTSTPNLHSWMIDAFSLERIAWSSGASAIVDVHFDRESEAARQQSKDGNLVHSWQLSNEAQRWLAH